MQKLTNRYLLIAAALFLVLSAYAVPAQNITASLRHARALGFGQPGTFGGPVPTANLLYVPNQSPGPALESSRFPALAGWFDLSMLYIAPKGRAAESRLEAVRSRTLAARENRPGEPTSVEFAW